MVLGKEVRGFLADHPRVMNALFALMILLSQVGTVIAGGDGHGGPWLDSEFSESIPAPRELTVKDDGKRP